MFRFLPSSKHQQQSPQQQQQDGGDDARVLSNAKSFESKLIPRGQSLLKKVIRRSRSSKSLSALKHFGRGTGNNNKDGDKKHQDDHHYHEPTTPHQNHFVAVFPTLATPPTALIHHGHDDHPDTQIVKNNSAEQHNNYSGRHHQAGSSLFLKSKSGSLFSSTPTADHVADIPHNNSHEEDEEEEEDVAILQERERIRQQLFYEEQGVEVTAQFRQTSTATTKASSNNASRRSPFARKNRNRNEQEEKKEEAATATNIDSITTTNIATPNKSYKGYSNDDSQMNNHSLTYSPAQTPETNADDYRNKSVDTSSSSLAMSLPPTPILNGLEADPVARFPAVAAAVWAKESQFKTHLCNTHDFLTATETETATNNHVDFALFPPSAMTGLDDTTVAAVTTANVVSPSPERPFDEAGTRPEDPTIKEIENTTGNTTSTATTSIVTTDNNKNNNAEGKDVTRKLLDVFNCGETPTATSPTDFTEFSSGSTYHIQYSAHPQHQEKGIQQKACRLVDVFYDNTCWTYREAIATKRLFYDEVFAQRFLKVSIYFCVHVV